MLLKDHTSVITGCNKGIGKEILKKFSESGSNIFACVRTIDDEFKSTINDLKSEYNNEIIPLELDLSNKQSVINTAQDIISHKTKINNLINNAGSISTSLFQMTTAQNYKELFEINFFSQILFTQYLIKQMIKNKNGNVLFISSSASLDGNEGRSVYVSTKSAINGQMKVLSREYGRFGIKVNSIAPGLTNTDMMKNNTPQNLIEEFKKNVSLKRIAEPSEIANVALFLCSSLSSYITGQIIRVDGGM